MIYPWGTERRINAYSEYMRKLFGERVQKLTINAGFTCPNRDGSKGRGGCTFCDNKAFNPSYNEACIPVEKQLNDGIEFHRKRYRRVSKYLAYFQAYTNTYADLPTLKSIYKPAIEHKDVIGIVIGTRPDCIDEEKLDYFSSLAKDRFVVIEYGIESIFNPTLLEINRGHDFETTRWAIEETAKRNIHAGGHLIIGLPGETKQDWMETIHVISGLPLHSVKFHQLQIIKGTEMARQYLNDPAQFRNFELTEYLELMADLVGQLNPGIILERIAGEISPETAVRKGWGIRYDRVLTEFEKILEKRNTWQGKYYKNNKTISKNTI